MLLTTFWDFNATLRWFQTDWSFTGLHHNVTFSSWNCSIIHPIKINYFTSRPTTTASQVDEWKIKQAGKLHQRGWGPSRSEDNDGGRIEFKINYWLMNPSWVGKIFSPSRYSRRHEYVWIFSCLKIISQLLSARLFQYCTADVIIIELSFFQVESGGIAQKFSMFSIRH